jgi:hypothetical protein
MCEITNLPARALSWTIRVCILISPSSTLPTRRKSLQSRIANDGVNIEKVYEDPEYCENLRFYKEWAC